MLRHLLLDVEVGDGAGVVLDEGAARLDLVAHQHREERGRRRRRPPSSPAASVRDLGPIVVSRELVGVHLAQALEALQRDALLRDRQHRRRAAPRTTAPPRVRVAEARRRTAACRRARRAARARGRTARYSCDVEQRVARCGACARGPVLRLDGADDAAARRSSSSSSVVVRLALDALRGRSARSRASTVATCSSSSADSSRNVTTSWPCSARSDDAQPSYCLSSRE